MNPILASGLTLIEVLFSLMILGFALLGLEALEMTGWRLNLQVYYASVAEQQIHNLEEALRFLGVGAGLDQAIENWKQETRLVLPQAQIQLGGAYPLYRLRLSWGEKQEGACEIRQGEYSGCVQENIGV